MLKPNSIPSGGIGSAVQALVYIFIGLTGLASAAIAYFALTFTIIEAALTGIVVAALSVVLFERTLRRRAEDELTRRIEDLSKLLSTDAHAGQILSQRVNEFSKINAGPRLTDLEADMSVLGTVIQQVAESVADVERFQTKLENKIGGALTSTTATGAQEAEYKWKLTSEDAERAIRQNRVECRIQKIINLPQRKAVAYDVVARIELPSGEFAGIEDIGAGRGRDTAVQTIEKMTRERAFSLAKQAATAEAEDILHTSLSRVSISSPAIADEIADMLDASTSAAKKMSFIITERDWRLLNPMERTALKAIVEKGARISIDQPNSLRLNFPELFQSGVTSVRADATRFIDAPESYAEFHSSDIADYIQRYDIDLIATAVRTEQQVLSLIEDNIRFASGDHIARQSSIPDNLFAPGELVRQTAVGASRAS